MPCIARRLRRSTARSANAVPTTYADAVRLRRMTSMCCKPVCHSPQQVGTARVLALLATALCTARKVLLIP